MVRVKRLELLSSAWKADIIALIRYPQMVLAGGFEPTEARGQQIYSLPDLTAFLYQHIWCPAMESHHLVLNTL